MLPALLSALPILVVVIAMTLFRLTAWMAGTLGLATAIALALGVLGVGSADLAPGMLLGGSFAEAAFVTVTILWIIFPALCIHELQKETGALATIRLGLMQASSAPRIQVLLVAWFFGLFMEGVAGFGTPVALAAPILVSLGLSAERAVVLALIGHAAGVSFGAVGTPVLPQISATGLSPIALAQPAALLHAACGALLVFTLYALGGTGRVPVRGLVWPAGAALAFFVPYLLVAWFIGPELPSIVGALIGGAAFAVAVSWHERRRGLEHSAEELGLRTLLWAGLPYFVLLALILVTRLVPGLGDLLRDAAITWDWGGQFSGRFEPLFHPGTMLLLGFVLGGIGQGLRPRVLGRAVAGAGGRLLVVAAALLVMLSLARLMVHSGMIEDLAEAAAASGPTWPVLAPLVGVLGTFVTGSATASNILFASFQEATAVSLGLPVALMEGAQNFGAAIGNVVSPHNIIAGGATVALAAGKEGGILRTTVIVCVVYALVGGLLVLLLSALG